MNRRERALLLEIEDIARGLKESWERMGSQAFEGANTGDLMADIERAGRNSNDQAEMGVLHLQDLFDAINRLDQYRRQ